MRLAVGDECPVRQMTLMIELKMKLHRSIRQRELRPSPSPVHRKFLEANWPTPYDRTSSPRIVTSRKSPWCRVLLDAAERLDRIYLAKSEKALA